jgi:hypothetical protein
MTRTPAGRMSRRTLLLSAAGLAGAAAFGRLRSSSAAGGPVKVLIDDVRQDGGDFGNGRHLGTQVRGGALSGAGIFESTVVESSFPFTHAGLHWQGNSSGLSATRLEVRTSEDGSSWTDWNRLLVEASGPETLSGETFAFLASAPRHRYLQYRATLTAAGQVNAVTTTFLNSKDGPLLPPTAGSLVASPVIDSTREDWGCDESLRFRGKREIWPRMFVPVKKLVLHHTASSAYDDGAAEVRAIYTYHAVTLGWGDIGYNALVDLWGNSYEGRYSRDLSDGREVFGPDVVAGHALAYNYGTCGIAAIGNFEDDDLPSDPAMLDRLKDLFTFRAAEREIDPAASSYFLDSTGVWSSGQLPNIFGHEDCNATLCPGKNLYPKLGEIRQAVAIGAALSSAPAFTGPDGPSAPSGNSLSYSWNNPGSLEFSFYLEGWYKSSSSENITYLDGFDGDRYPAWSNWSTATSAQFSNLPDGHYTFHLRSRPSGGGQESYQANKTVLVQGPKGHRRR